MFIRSIVERIRGRKRREKVKVEIEELKKALLEDPRFRDEVLKELEYRTGRRDLLKVGALGLLGALGLAGGVSGVLSSTTPNATPTVSSNTAREIVSDYSGVKVLKPCTCIVAQDGTGDYDVSPGEDASEVIQKAIDYAHGKGGGEVRIREGNYYISSKILLKDNIALVGNIDNTAIDLPIDTDLTIFRNDNTNIGNKNIYISGIILNGNYRKIINGTRPLIEMVNVNRLTLEDLFITNPANFAMHIRKCNNVIVQKIRIESDGLHRDGIKLNGVQNAVISNCIIDSGDDCISVTAQDKEPRNIIISNNICRSKKARGILVNHADIGSYVPISNITIQNNLIYETRGVGICIYSNNINKPFYNIKISNNVLSNTKRNGIACLGPPTKIINLIISTNIIKKPLGRGIYVINAEKVSIIGNLVEGAEADQGILVGEPENPCNNFVIAENIIDGLDTTDWGIHISASSNGVISNNIIKNCIQGIRGTGNSSYPCLNVICIGNHCYISKQIINTYGIKTAGNTDEWIVIGNIIKNALTPIMLAGVNNILQNNLTNLKLHEK